jgi:hypothetical protein
MNFSQHTVDFGGAINFGAIFSKVWRLGLGSTIGTDHITSAGPHPYHLHLSFLLYYYIIEARVEEVDALMKIWWAGEIKDDLDD